MGRLASNAKTNAAAPDALKQRAFERHDTRMRALLHFRARYQSVIVRDVSPGGMKLEKAFGLMPGDIVTIELMSGRAFQGKVMWSVAPFCGLAFENTLEQQDPLLDLCRPLGSAQKPLGRPG